MRDVAAYVTGTSRLCASAGCRLMNFNADGRVSLSLERLWNAAVATSGD
jgi:hypothetical protein